MDIIETSLNQLLAEIRRNPVKLYPVDKNRNAKDGFFYDGKNAGYKSNGLLLGYHMERSHIEWCTKEFDQVKEKLQKQVEMKVDWYYLTVGECRSVVFTFME